MSIESQMLGKRLAKSVNTRAEAEALLSQRSHIFGFWQFVLILAGSLSLGWVASQRVSGILMLVSGVADLAIILSAAAIFECIKLRRRVQALIILSYVKDIDNTPPSTSPRF